jgi:hypothetical protein
MGAGFGPALSAHERHVKILFLCIPGCTGGQNVTRKLGYQGAYLGMSESGHRSCKCGAVYRRTESMAPARQIDSYECAVCGSTLESWNTAWVPAFRLITGPVISEQSHLPDS